MHGQELKRNDCEDPLKTVLRVRDLQGLVGVDLGLLVVFVTDQYRITLQQQPPRSAAPKSNSTARGISSYTPTPQSEVTKQHRFFGGGGGIMCP